MVFGCLLSPTGVSPVGVCTATMVNGDDLSTLTRRHGIKIGLGFHCSVEDLCLAVGGGFGYDRIKSAARMNGAVVIFLYQLEKVNRVVETAITVN